MKSNLQILREEHHYTKKYIAKYLNCSRNTYPKYEANPMLLPPDKIIKLKHLYNINTEYILNLKPYNKS